MGINNRINEALELRNMKAVELAELTGLSQGVISSYRKQRWQPKQTALYSMAKVLDVSEMWLAGYDVPMERPLVQKEADNLAVIINKIKNDRRYQDIVSCILELDEGKLRVLELMVEQLNK